MNRTDAAAPFLTARWIQLAMVNYEVDPDVLRALVPKGTELDFWSGRCFVSMVGFQFVDTRVLGLSIPFHSDFDEVNLRFYVRRVVAGGVRRGVVFVKEVVPRRAIAWLANALYNEKYVALAMAHDDATATSRRLITKGGTTASGAVLASRSKANRISPPRSRRRRSSPSTTGATPCSATGRRANTRSSIRAGTCGKVRARSSSATFPVFTARSSLRP